ncbi:S1 family peptidase [Roseovarius bejariae]|uniref:S1 family peptidase n=1 Tax=Roseovarius bejariae TaxID=2576383 RepID=UPI0012AD7D3F|nr:serine protease [Roseovarius bejariae]
MTYLQSYVVPICTYDIDEERADLKRLHGTAFYFGANGFYLTARHVIEAALKAAEQDDVKAGLVVKSNHGQGLESMALDLKQYEFAPQPFDVAVGRSGYFPKTPLRTNMTEAHVWTDIAALGYPDSASVKDQDGLWMNVRGYRGHIQRPTIPRDIAIGTHPNGFELSFLTGPGSSGGPVFCVDTETVIGVIVASFRSEHIEDQVVEVQSNGAEYREMRVRVEQFGFAHDIRGLLDWKADLFEGHTLSEISEMPFGQLPSTRDLAP